MFEFDSDFAFGEETDEEFHARFERTVGKLFFVDATESFGDAFKESGFEVVIGELLQFSPHGKGEIGVGGSHFPPTERGEEVQEGWTSPSAGEFSSFDQLHVCEAIEPHSDGGLGHAKTLAQVGDRRAGLATEQIENGMVDRSDAVSEIVLFHFVESHCKSNLD